MSLSITVSIDSAAANASLRAITRATQDRVGMHDVIATAARELVRDHLETKYFPRDKDGLAFWRDVWKSAEANHDNERATVTLRESFIALRYYGGEVTPGKSISSYTGRPTRALAIPSKAVMVKDGRRVQPSQSGILAFIHAARGRETVGYLVEGVEIVAKHGPNKGKKITLPKVGGKLLYTLRTITRHRGDSGILPPVAAITTAAAQAIEDFIDSFE
jgi:hypothetical protein